MSLTFDSSGTIKFRPLWRQISLNRAAAKASPAPVEDPLHHAANARVSLQKGRASLANVNATQQHARTHLDTQCYTSWGKTQALGQMKVTVLEHSNRWKNVRKVE